MGRLSGTFWRKRCGDRMPQWTLISRETNAPTRRESGGCPRVDTHKLSPVAGTCGGSLAAWKHRIGGLRNGARCFFGVERREDASAVSRRRHSHPRHGEAWRGSAVARASENRVVIHPSRWPILSLWGVRRSRQGSFLRDPHQTGSWIRPSR